MLRAKRSAWALAVALVAVPAMSEPEPVDVNGESEKKPFLLPTFKGEKTSHHAPPTPDPAPTFPDPREIYERALNCWPTASYMRAELSVEGRLQTTTITALDETGMFRAQGRSSAALVARVPLYSATELDREREREYIRRTKLADSAGSFITALADRQKTRRELDLMLALEKRSQQRVKIGVTDTAEQVGYLQKVVQLEGDLLKQRGQLEKSRLELIGHCMSKHADEVDRYILQFIEAK